MENFRIFSTLRKWALFIYNHKVFILVLGAIISCFINFAFERMTTNNHFLEIRDVNFEDTSLNKKGLRIIFNIEGKCYSLPKKTPFSLSNRIGDEDLKNFTESSNCDINIIVHDSCRFITFQCESFDISSSQVYQKKTLFDISTMDSTVITFRIDEE